MVMEVWPNPLPSIADAALTAIALTNRYDAVATLDRKLAKRMQDFGVAAYW
jgi:rRNA-processing protein FCF1